MVTRDLSSGEPQHTTRPIDSKQPSLRFPYRRPKWAYPRSTFTQTRSPQVIIGIVFTIIFVMGFGGGLMAMPGLRLYEDIICHNYHNRLEGKDHIGLDGHIDEEQCKGDEVQNQMNIFLGVLAFLSPMPGLLTTIPYGLLADRIGRKPVFALAMTGILLGGCYNMMVLSLWKILPIQLLWFSPIFMLIGGGPALTSMMFYAIGCDITTEATRTNVFLFGHGAGLLAGLIAPSIAGTLMAISPWVSMISGMIILAIGGCMMVFVPETLHLRLSASGILVDASPAERDVSPSRKTDKPGSYFATVKSQFADGLNKISSATTVLHSLPILLLLLTFITPIFASVADHLSYRYISKVFHWKLREVSFLLSLHAFINLILLVAIIPLLSNLLMNRLGFSSKSKDLFLARFSLIVMVLGALLIASSGTIGLTIFGLIISTLGTGYSSFARSLITTLVDQQHVGRLFAAISVVETLGALAAGPSLNALYSVGLKSGGAWIGLPFYFLAFICFMGGVTVWSFAILTRNQRRRQDMPFGEEYGDDYADARLLFGDLEVMDPDDAGEGRIRL